MSHSVLVETSRRFVEAFYEALASAQRVGDAMLAGQRELKDDSFRGRIFGAGELRLEDWFVPVLYQEKEDPQLFKITPTKQTEEDFKAALETRLGHLPPPPETGFIGRSRELLALQRLTREDRYSVVRGQGGEGKTALAAEFARWIVRSQQMHRAAFVSVETYGNQRAVVDALGKQLVQKDFTAAGDLEEAIKEVERALREQSAVLVIDNMESVLLPPFMQEETPEALSEDAAEELKAILTLCERLLKVGDTRVIFTSREALPAPFNAARNRRELRQLDRQDAVKLVERVLNVADSDAGASSDAAREEIEQLVDAVHCHARTLALLAPSLREHGVETTRQSLVELMTEMEKNFPGSREKSVFASVELSLRRMSQTNQDRARVLGAFHGGVNLNILRAMMQWERKDAASLAGELIQTGLATANRYNHLTLNPALCPYLRGLMNATEREESTVRWIKAMLEYVELLIQQQGRETEVVATLTVLESPNLFALLDLVESMGNAEATIHLSTWLYELLQKLDKPQLLKRVGNARDVAAAALGDAWNHASFQAAQTRVDQTLTAGRLREALVGAQQLLRRTQLAGEHAYPSADYDLAMALFLLARVWKTIGGSDTALPLLNEARRRFEAIAKARTSKQAEGMASASITETGDCLRNLGRFDEAAAAYQEALRRDEMRAADRDIAIGKIQLGTVRLLQRRYSEALVAYAEARERFMHLDEPESVARTWHQTGISYEQAEQPEAAEDAYRKSLAIKVRLGDVRGQVSTLAQLGNLYGNLLDRPEEAVAFFQQAAVKCLEIGDVAREGNARCNLARTLQRLGRLEEARQETHQAIECSTQFGHASQPWLNWDILTEIEADAGNPAAAADAKRKAIDYYVAYRRDGGENQVAEGRLSLAVTESLLGGDATAATSLLQQLAIDPDLPSHWNTYIRALEAIVAGSRDRALADNPDLNYVMAAEILLLIETLEKRG
jgi:tetratricopeptide (TPR) repeat protein